MEQKRMSLSSTWEQKRMKFPEAKGSISFKVAGIQQVTGVVINREPMVRVRFDSGNEITAPVIPTMNALLDLDHDHNTVEWALIRECLGVLESARIGEIPSNKKGPATNGPANKNNRYSQYNRSVLQKPF